MPPPCSSCPKKEIDLAGEKRLSRRNQKAHRFWQELQASHGAQPIPAHLENCAVFAENMATISRIYKAAESTLKLRAYDQAKG